MVGSWNLLEKFAPVVLDNFLAGHVFPKSQIKKISPKIKRKNILRGKNKYTGHYVFF